MEIKIVKYNNDLHRKDVVNLWKNVFDYTQPRNNPETVIDKKIEINNDLFFVAVDSTKVIGTIMAGYDGHRGWIYSLAVLPEERNKKIGSTLLKAAEQRLINLGCLKINLQILTSNENVIQFYKKNGYEIEERISMGKVLE